MWEIFFNKNWVSINIPWGNNDRDSVIENILKTYTLEIDSSAVIDRTH